uniref:Uncharacterized protein n=1 Tax=Gopherus evgoodei TaxID=1825980 RepID=A0A8C4YD81_9SAUR
GLPLRLTLQLVPFPPRLGDAPRAHLVQSLSAPGCQNAPAAFSPNCQPPLSSREASPKQNESPQPCRQRRGSCYHRGRCSPMLWLGGEPLPLLFALPYYKLCPLPFL